MTDLSLAETPPEDSQRKKWFSSSNSSSALSMTQKHRSRNPEDDRLDISEREHLCSEHQIGTSIEANLKALKKMIGPSWDIPISLCCSDSQGPCWCCHH